VFSQTIDFTEFVKTKIMLKHKLYEEI